MAKRLLVVCTLAALSCGTVAQTYECIDARGAVRYSPTPCAAQETGRDLRSIRRRGSENQAQTSNDYYAEERARKDREREAAARAQEEQRRERELLRMEQQMRLEAAAGLLEKLRAEQAAGK